MWLNQRPMLFWLRRLIPSLRTNVKGLFESGRSFAWISAFVAVAIGGAAALMILQNRQTTLADHLSAMDNKGVVLVEQTSRYVQVIDILMDDVLSRIADLQIATPVDLQVQLGTREFKGYLTERLTRGPQIATIALIGEEGQVINWSRDEPVGNLAVGDREYFLHFKQYNQQGLFIGLVSKSLVTGKLALFFARRISAPDGKFLGLVLAVVEISHLGDFYQAAGEKLNETIALLRNDGTMLIRHPNPELAVGFKLPDTSPWYKTVNDGGGSYVTTATLKGVRSVVSVHLLHDYPLVIDILMDSADVFAQWKRQSIFISALAVSAALASVTFFWILGRQFRRLSESAVHLRHGQEKLRSYAEMSADWFWEQDANFRFTFDAGIPFMSSSDDAGKTRRDLGDPTMAEERWKPHEDDLTARRPFRDFHWERVGSDGETHFISTSGDPVFSEDGVFIGYRGTGRDVTSEVRARERLAQANAELELERQDFSAVLSNISQGVCLYSADRRLRLCNPRYVDIYKLPPEAILPGRSLEAIMALRIEAGSAPMSAPDYLAWWSQSCQLKETGSSVVTLKDGRSIGINYQFMPDGSWVATHEDITERQQAEASIMFMARHDSLTKLPNRMLFRERMEKAIAMTGRGTQFSVLCLDLDKFKHVNDTMGHPVGDALLVAVADRLRSCVREGDTVARLGGDEFAIIQLAVQQPNNAEVLASRIIDAFAEPFDVDGYQIVSAVSLGVAVAPSDGVSYETLMRDADIALYLAKTERRGAVRFFEPEMDSRIHLRRVLERDLQGAVVRNEFELYYQPQVNVVSDRISGFEALLRWNHPVRGFISPLEFVAVAEETGIIVAIGAWVLRTACLEAGNWPVDVSVAVNLSPIQFSRGDLVTTIRDALEASGLQPSRLELEITESVFLDTTAHTLEMLHELRAMGISIALDDFGTGYSSLGYLRSFAVNKIKIDKSFIRDLMTNEESMLIVRAVIGLGQSLGMSTIAEGVETQDQLIQLSAMGCTEVQGYLLSRPRAATEVLAMCELLRI